MNRMMFPGTSCYPLSPMKIVKDDKENPAPPDQKQNSKIDKDD